MEDLRFREYTTTEEGYRQALSLRNQILRLPLGLDLLTEDLAVEVAQWHFVLWRSDTLVASVTIKPLAHDRAKLRQMCVSPAEQGRGLGTLLVEQVEQVMRDRGIREIELAARVPVVPFYQHLGYQAVGQSFLEVTIPHQTMLKRLTSEA